MAVLDQFKLSSETPKKDLSPLGRFRRRLKDAIDLQIEIAKADLAGQQIHRTRQRRVKVGANGEKELREVPIRLRRWWWTDERGTTFVTLKYGAMQLDLAPGKKAIEIGQIEELPAKLELLGNAVRAGELDACAKTGAVRRSALKRPTITLAATKATSPKT